jgi:hypothetical protein
MLSPSFQLLRVRKSNSLFHEPAIRRIHNLTCTNCTGELYIPMCVIRGVILQGLFCEVYELENYYESQIKTMG